MIRYGAILLCVLAIGWPGVAPARASSLYYVTPEGGGSRDGSSWENAGKLEDVAAFVAAASPGSTILLRADAGPYRVTSQIGIRAGGAPGNPITISGADSVGRPMAASIIGTRSDPYDPGGRKGKEVFRLLSGADHLRFRFLDFRNIGNGAFRIGADIAQLTIEDVTAENVMRLIENTASGKARSASIKGLTVRRVSVEGFSRGVARLRYGSSGILLEDVTGDSQRRDTGSFAIGVHLDGTVHDVVLRNVVMLNARDTRHKYWNGDGFVAEEGTYRIRFEDTLASGNADAGYDLKSTDTLLVNTVATGNKRNYRFWGEAVVRSCVGEDPWRRGGSGSQAQIWIGSRARVEVESCVLEDARPETIVFDVESGGMMSVSDTTISKHDDAALSRVESGGMLSLDGQVIGQ